MFSVLFKGLRATALMAAVFIVLGAAWLFTQGYSKTPERWWYPFIASVLTDHYTAGPFAMTSNTREDNPIWPQLPAFNKAQARLTYAMTRGEPQVDIAWLYANSEWPDAPALPFGGINPNAQESPVSRALSAAGITYDWISRREMQRSQAGDKGLRVGKMQYRALLISGLDNADPLLLENIISLAQAGVPVFWTGDWPHRASGWGNHELRDQTVIRHSSALKRLVTVVPDAATLASALDKQGIEAALRSASGPMTPLRNSQRRLGSSYHILLFNESEQPASGEYHSSLKYQKAYLMNPESGERQILADSSAAKSLAIKIPAGRTRVLQLLGADDSELAATAGVGESWDASVWENPPRSMYPFIRWWWPGNAVEPEELKRELNSLYQAGYGGVELQTLTIGFTFEQLRAHREAIYQVGTPAYLANLKVVFEQAQQLGMAVDLTLGSGWSGGGPFIDERPQQQLLQSSIDIDGPMAFSGAIPIAVEPGYVQGTNWVIKNTIGEFDKDLILEAVVAATLDESSDPPALSAFTDISSKVSDGQLHWQVPDGRHRIFALYRNNTSHNAVAAAYPGALERAPILDHLHPGGVQEYIRKLGAPWLEGVLPFKPRAWFVDSFELIAELPWTEGFASTFKSMHGYDLKPLLPLVFMAQGESKYVNVMSAPSLAYQSEADMAERVREDYELTRQQLFLDAFLKPLKQWTKRQGIALRVQAHGGYGDYLDAYQMADVPESEGLFASGSYEFLKMASSAGHVAGAREVSSESFINLSFDFNRHSLDDYYFLAGHAFSAGINRTVCHGYAYHFPVYGEASSAVE